MCLFEALCILLASETCVLNCFIFQMWFSCHINWTYFLVMCRYWVLAGPIYLCVTLLFIVIIYVAYNFICTPSLDSIYTITGMLTFPLAPLAFSLPHDKSWSSIAQLSPEPSCLTVSSIYPRWGLFLTPMGGEHF